MTYNDNYSNKFSKADRSTYYQITTDDISNFIKSNPSVDKIDELLSVYIHDKCIVLILNHLKKEITVIKELVFFSYFPKNVINKILKYLKIYYPPINEHKKKLKKLYNYFRDKLKKPYKYMYLQDKENYKMVETYPKYLSKKENQGKEETCWLLATSYHERHRTYEESKSKTRARILIQRELNITDVYKNFNDHRDVEFDNMFKGINNMDLWYIDD